MTWTAHCFDREADYSVAWEGDRVEVTYQPHGTVSIEVMDGNTRSARIIVPASALERNKDNPTRTARKPKAEMDFG